MTGLAGPALLAGLLAAAAVLVASAGPAPLPSRPGGSGSRPRVRVVRHVWLPVVVLAPVAVLLTPAGRLDGTRPVLLLVLAVAVAGVAALLRRRSAARELDRVRDRVVELSEALVGELRAGAPVVPALERSAAVWAPFSPVAAAARLGADVPVALDRLAERPGAEELRRVASAWRVSQRTGCSLVVVLDQVAVSARAASASARQVRAELSSAQATARLVAVLPVLTLSMAAGTSADPWRFLLTRPAGVACLAAGVLLVLAGLWWMDRIAVTAVRP